MDEGGVPTDPHFKGGKVEKLKDALGEIVPHVWGYEEPDCKKRRSSGDGEIKPLFWTPTKLIWPCATVS